MAPSESAGCNWTYGDMCLAPPPYAELPGPALHKAQANQHQGGEPLLSTLVDTLRRHKGFAADATYANSAIAPLVMALGPALEQELQQLLARFGWGGPQAGFTRMLDLAGLTAALQKYQYVKVAVLGTGAYGAVHKVYHRETQELLAIKQVRTTEFGLCEATVREIATLRELRHPNIVGLRDVISSVAGKYCYLVLELLACDLHTFLQHRPEASDLGTIKSIMFQLLSGLRHAHSHSVMHRDVKPQNVLLGPADPATCSPAGGASGRVQVKLADFGLARSYLPDEHAYTDWVVTLYYRAPELLLGSHSYGPGVDVWSAGCVLAELLNVAPLFKADSEIGLLYDMFQKMGTPTPAAWPELPKLNASFDQLPQWSAQPLQKLVPRLALDPLGADLLSKMLAYNPRKRISASQALQHQWFDDVRAAELAAVAAVQPAPQWVR